MIGKKKCNRDLKLDDMAIYVSPEGIKSIEQAIINLEKAQIELKKVAEGMASVTQLVTKPIIDK